MSGGTKPLGYTIVEVMIFLAVSGALLVSALLIFNGRQQRIEFGQSIRDIDSKIRDVLNDVSTGVYNYTNNFQCTAPLDGTKPPDLVAQAAANNQGANVGCTFIGRVMQFGPSSDRTAFNTFSVVGRQYTGSPLSSAEVQNLAQAHPMPISPTLAAPARPNATESGQLGYGLQLQSITYDNGSGPQPIGAFGFFTNFTSYSITGSLQSSKQFTDLWAVVPSSLDKTQEDTAQAIIDMDTSAASKNPQNGITLCFVSASSSQYGKIVVGDDQNRLSTQLTIGEGSVCL